MFRVSLAILKVMENQILNISEQVSMLVFLKKVISHIFDMEEIFEVGSRDRNDPSVIVAKIFQIFASSSWLNLQNLKGFVLSIDLSLP